jgi:hypothetical protein
LACRSTPSEALTDFTISDADVGTTIGPAVVSATLMVTIKGQTAARTGTLAYTFSKHGEEWKIDAQAWGRTS